MPTSVDIDDDLFQVARERADGKGRSIGEVLSDLVRQALAGRTSVPPQGDHRLPADYGIVPLPHRGGRVTDEPVDRLRDQQGM